MLITNNYDNMRNTNKTLRDKSPNTEFFMVRISFIRIEYGDLRSIALRLVKMS